MNPPAAFDILRKYGIRPVSQKSKFDSNCPKCGGPISNAVELDDDGQGFRCHCPCGFSAAERVRSVLARPQGNGKAAPDDDCARRLAEARRAFEEQRDQDFPEDDHEPEQKPEPEPEPEPELVEPKPKPEPPPLPTDEAALLAELDFEPTTLREVELSAAELAALDVEYALKENPTGRFKEKTLEKIARLKREYPEQFERLCKTYPVLAALPPKRKPPPPPADEDEALAELNDDNCLVLDGSKAWVLRLEHVHHNLNGRRYSYQVPIFLRSSDFCTLYMNRRVIISTPTGDLSVELGRWWLRHPARRQYLGVVCKPGSGPVVDGKYNLWTGWGVTPKGGDWSLMRKHIRDVLAAGDEAVYVYIINWLAWAVQHPNQQPETALVFLGKRGSGRGTLGNFMCRIFGNHGLHISSPHHLVGRFNAHLRQVCFSFADEAYAVADKSAESRFKGLITEATIPIEGKGKDVITAPNHLHVMLASNDDWVVPAGEIERRFEVAEVANDHAQDPAWFEPLYKQMEQGGGLEAMLFDLLNRDLGKWHPRQIVRTAALAEQQEESLSAFDAWWLELLHTGVLAGANDLDPDKAISNRYEEEISERDEYGNTRKRVVLRDGLYDQARRISPKLKAVTDAALGRYLSNKKGCVRATRAWVQRKRGWQFPPLAECRKRWSERFPDTVWDKTKGWLYPETAPDADLIDE